MLPFSSEYPFAIQLVFKLTGRFNTLILVKPNFFNVKKAGCILGHLVKGQQPQ